MLVVRMCVSKYVGVLRDNFKIQLPVDRRFCPVRLVSIVLNNDNRSEPDRTIGQPAVGF